MGGVARGLAVLSEDVRSGTGRSKNLAHYIENIGDEPVRVLNVFNRKDYVDVSLNQWLALMPAAMVQGHLQADVTLMHSLRKERCSVVK